MKTGKICLCTTTLKYDILIKLVNANFGGKKGQIFVKPDLTFAKIHGNRNQHTLLVCSFICFQSVQANQILPGKSLLAF